MQNRKTDEHLFDLFHDPAIAGQLARRLASMRISRPLTLMHVCGTHEHSIARAGIRSFLPDGVRLIAGPGCPVCVCPARDIDLAVEAAKRDDTIVVTFGDMFRVPSTEASLELMRAEGHDVRVVYSPIDAVRIAEENPDFRVVFMAVGFETTAGPIAASLHQGPPDNFSIITSLRLIPPALRFLLDQHIGSVDGFILPGHVSTVLGREGYLFMETEYNVPGVIAGFEPVDMLRAIVELADQVIAGPPHKIVNLYKRTVSEGGNARAREIISEMFEETDSIWRGIGTIPFSGLSLKEEYGRLDAVRALELSLSFDPVDVRPGCMCHRVILGETEPEDCPLFGEACNPRRPYGPCMVSSEGTCRARYQYRQV